MPQLFPANSFCSGQPVTSLRQIQEEEARKLKALQRSQQNLQQKVFEKFPLHLFSWGIAISNPSVLENSRKISKWHCFSMDWPQFGTHINAYSQVCRYSSFKICIWKVSEGLWFSLESLILQWRYIVRMNQVNISLPHFLQNGLKTFDHHCWWHTTTHNKMMIILFMVTNRNPIDT